jgi:hypothetical protein
MPVMTACGPNHLRLQQVKAACDPEHFFCMDHNIPPRS